MLVYIIKFTSLPLHPDPIFLEHLFSTGCLTRKFSGGSEFLKIQNKEEFSIVDNVKKGEGNIKIVIRRWLRYLGALSCFARIPAVLCFLFYAAITCEKFLYEKTRCPLYCRGFHFTWEKFSHILSVGSKSNFTYPCNGKVMIM